jgi:hypothetical protein
LLIFSSFRRKIIVALLGIVLFFTGAIIEQKVGVNLRVNEFVKQVSSLNKENKDLAEFGSQRGGQVLPSLKKLKNDKLLWVGVGFLHNELSRSGKFMVDSYFNKEPDVMGVVEVTQIATLINIGIIGLLFLHFYFFGLFFFLPRLPETNWYLETIVLFSLFGLGGFSGLNGYPTIIWVGLCIGVILLIHKQKTFEIKVIEQFHSLDTMQSA